MSYPFARPVLDADPFVRVRVVPRPPRDPRPHDVAAGPPPEIVLVRRDEPLRADALVVARDADGLSLRRVGRMSADAVELLPVAADAHPVRVPADARAVVGTVVMRWCAEGAA